MIKINKKILIIIVSLFILFILVIVLNLIKNDSSTIIKNYDSYIKDLSVKRRKEVDNSLLNIISLTKEDNKNISALIRNNSYKESYDEDNKVYESVFIVDIKSIKQSYKIYLKWSKINSNKLTGDILRFNCLKDDEIIYKNFNCKKYLYTVEEKNDPIVKLLPYSSNKYKIILKEDINNKTGLEVIIFINMSDIRTYGNKDKALNYYKIGISEWFISNSLDINNYEIIYTIY